MRWFVGAVALDDGEVEVSRVRQLIAKIDSPGMEKREICSSDEVCAFVMVEGNDLSERKAQPVSRNGLICIGDVRIDNREELWADWKETTHESNQTDELLILNMFIKFGNDFVTRLEGEFVFVIVDKHNKSVFAARDQLGVKTLFWSRQGNQVWWSTDIFLLESVANLRHFNKAYFQLYCLTQGIVDSIETPYQEVHRLSSATWIEMVRDDDKQVTYWDVSRIESDINYSTSFEYEEHFRHLLQRSVAVRMNRSAKNSVMLSGGLDSTSVFAMCKQIEKEQPGIAQTLPVCGVFEELKDCDEREFIDPLLQMYGVQGIQVNLDEEGPLKGYPDEQPWMDEPQISLLSYKFQESLMKRARQAGATTMLTGYAGDHVLAGSEMVLGDLLREGRIKELLHHSAELARAIRGSTPRILWENALAPQLGFGAVKEIRKHLDKQTQSNMTKLNSFKRMNFALQIRGTKARLYMDRALGPQIGIRMKHPFLDFRMIDFLCRVPGLLMWGGGWQTKSLLRKTMNGYLPEQILTRRNKTEHSSQFYRSIVKFWPVVYPVIRRGRVAELGLIQHDEWIRELNNWRQGFDVQEYLLVLLSLEFWLYRWEQKGGV